MDTTGRLEARNYHCKECGYQWTSFRPVKPAVCPACRSPRWNVTLASGQDNPDGIKPEDNHRMIMQEISKKLLQKSQDSSTIVKELNKLEMENVLAQVNTALTSRDWELMEEATWHLINAVRRLVEPETDQPDLSLTGENRQERR